MANKYCRSGAGGAGTGADWANAYTTFVAAAAGMAAGDDLWVAADHNETTAGNVTVAWPGTAASPNRIICAIHTGSVPPVSADLRTTAVVNMTGANTLRLNGTFYMEGVILNAGDAANNAWIVLGVNSDITATLKNCQLKLNHTAAGGRIYLGSNPIAYLKLVNTTLTFGNVGQSISFGTVRLCWENTASALGGATFPDILFIQGAGVSMGDAYLHGVDLSALGAGKQLFPSSGTYQSNFVLHDCKLGASVTVAGTSISPKATNVYVVRSSSSAVAYTHEKHGAYEGTETVETTIVRTGGASVNGTGIAKKYVTTANAKYHQPFEAIPIAVANSTTGSNRVVTVYGVWGGGAVPTNADIWFDVSYLGSASSPQATFNTTGKADILAAASNHSADSSTWGGSTTKFKMTVTLSSPQPQLAGEMYVQIYVGAASATIYIDPKVELS